MGLIILNVLLGAAYVSAIIGLILVIAWIIWYLAMGYGH